MAADDRIVRPHVSFTALVLRIRMKLVRPEPAHQRLPEKARTDRVIDAFDAVDLRTEEILE